MDVNGHPSSPFSSKSELQQSEERKDDARLQRALEIATVGVVFFKTSGEITHANNAFLRMSGYSRKDVEQGFVRWDTMTPPQATP